MLGKEDAEHDRAAMYLGPKDELSTRNLRDINLRYHFCNIQIYAIQLKHREQAEFKR